MAVASRGAALSAFRELIHDDPVEARAILRRPYLPEGLDLSRDPVGMDPATLIGGYGKEARYTLGADPATMLAIAGPPGMCCPAVRRSRATPSRRTRKPASTSPWRVAPPQGWSIH